MYAMGTPRGRVDSRIQRTLVYANTCATISAALQEVALILEQRPLPLIMSSTGAYRASGLALAGSRVRSIRSAKSASELCEVFREFCEVTPSENAERRESTILSRHLRGGGQVGRRSNAPDSVAIPCQER
jgi:hypothetical protein